MTPKAIPDGYRAITPYLIVDGASDYIEFLKKAFGAKIMMRLDGPGGIVGHAEVLIGDSRLMLADGCEEYKPTQGMIYLYVENSDAIYLRAINAGASPLEPVQDKFYGDRSGTVIDPAGNRWAISTHVEDLSEEEIGRRANEFMQNEAASGEN